MRRLQRFETAGDEKNKGPSWFPLCIQTFREPIGFPVETCVPRPKPFLENIKTLIDKHKQFIGGDDNDSDIASTHRRHRVAAVLDKVRATSSNTNITG